MRNWARSVDSWKDFGDFVRSGTKETGGEVDGRPMIEIDAVNEDQREASRI